jgi:uncharacterized protein YegL
VAITPLPHGEDQIGVDGEPVRRQRKGRVLVNGPEGNILPIYFVADCSGSMEGDPINEVNRGLSSLLDSLQSESMAAARVRFCVIGFDDTPHCYVEPADLRNLESMPKLSSGGTTSYAAVLNELYRRLPLDISKLKTAGYIVNRPAVFFLTDGMPNRSDGWESAYRRLSNPGFPTPNILGFGIGDADAETIKRIASKPQYAFIAAKGVDTGRAITEFIKALTKSVITSGRALAGGQATLPIEKPEGFISLDVDTV